MSEPIAYLKGDFIPATDALLPVYDAGIVVGATVTEMIRTFLHKPFKLEEHVDRLIRSMKYVRFDSGLSRADLIDITMKVSEHNCALLGEGKELGIIQFVTAGVFSVYAGSAGRGGKMKPTVCVHTFPLPLHLWAKGYGNGLHAVTPSNRHVPPQCIDPKMKYRSRLHFYLAEQEVQMVDPHASALLLDLSGNVTETGGANFLIVSGGTIVSPTLTNILPGVSRAMVIELAAKLDIPFVQRDFQLFDVVNADEAFTTTTPYCMMPVTRINGQSIADGKPGPVYKRLLEAWSGEVGLDIRQQIIDGAKRRRDG